MKVSKLFCLLLLSPALLALSADECIENKARLLTAEGQKRFTAITGKDVVVTVNVHYEADPTPVMGKDASPFASPARKSSKPAHTKKPTFRSIWSRNFNRSPRTTSRSKTRFGRRGTRKGSPVKDVANAIMRAVTKPEIGKPKEVQVGDVIMTKDNQAISLTEVKNGNFVASVLNGIVKGKPKAGARPKKFIKTTEGMATLYENRDGTCSLTEEKKNCTAYGYNECMKYCANPTRGKDGQLTCPGGSYKRLCKGKVCSLWKNEIKKRMVPVTYKEAAINPAYNRLLEAINRIGFSINDQKMHIMRIREGSFADMLSLKRIQTVQADKAKNINDKNIIDVRKKYQDENNSAFNEYNNDIRRIIEALGKELTDFDTEAKKREEAIKKVIFDQLDDFEKLWAEKKKKFGSDCEYCKKYPEAYNEWKQKWDAAQARIKAAIEVAEKDFEIFEKQKLAEYNEQLTELRQQQQLAIKEAIIKSQENDDAEIGKWIDRFNKRQAELDIEVQKRESEFSKFVTALEEKLKIQIDSTLEDWHQKFVDFVNKKKAEMEAAQKQYAADRTKIKADMNKKIDDLKADRDAKIQAAKDASLKEQEAKLKEIAAKREQYMKDFEKAEADDKAAKEKQQAAWEEEKVNQLKKVVSELKIKLGELQNAYDKDVVKAKAAADEQEAGVKQQYEAELKKLSEQLKAATKSAQDEYDTIEGTKAAALNEDEEKRRKELMAKAKKAHDEKRQEYIDEINRIVAARKKFDKEDRARGLKLIKEEYSELIREEKQLCDKYQITNEELLKELEKKFTVKRCIQDYEITKVFDDKGELKKEFEHSGCAGVVEVIAGDRIHEAMKEVTAEQQQVFVKLEKDFRKKLEQLKKDWWKQHDAAMDKFRDEQDDAEIDRDGVDMDVYTAEAKQKFLEEKAALEKAFDKQKEEQEKIRDEKIKAARAQFDKGFDAALELKEENIRKILKKRDDEINRLTLELKQQKAELEKTAADEKARIENFFQEKIDRLRRDHSKVTKAKELLESKLQELENAKDAAVRFFEKKLDEAVEMIEQQFDLSRKIAISDAEKLLKQRKAAFKKLKRDWRQALRDEEERNHAARDAEIKRLKEEFSKTKSAEERRMEEDVRRIRIDAKWNEVQEKANEEIRAKIKAAFEADKARIDKYYAGLVKQAQEQFIADKKKWDEKFKKDIAAYHYEADDAEAVKKASDEFTKRWRETIKLEINQNLEQFNIDFEKARQQLDETFAKKRKEVEEQLQKLKEQYVARRDSLRKEEAHLNSDWEKKQQDLYNQLQKDIAALKKKTEELVEKLDKEIQDKIRANLKAVEEEINKINSQIAEEEDEIKGLRAELAKTDKHVYYDFHDVKEEKFNERTCDNWVRGEETTVEQKHCISRDEAFGVEVCTKMTPKTGKCIKKETVYPYEACVEMKVEKQKNGDVKNDCRKYVRAYPRIKCNTWPRAIDGKLVCTDRTLVKPGLFCRKYNLVDGVRTCERNGLFYGRTYRFTCTKTGKVLTPPNESFKPEKGDTNCIACLNYEKNKKKLEEEEALERLEQDIVGDMNDKDDELVNNARILRSVSVASDAEKVGRQLSTFNARDQRILRSCALKK